MPKNKKQIKEKLNDDAVIVGYKYTITMPIAYETLSVAKNKWLIKEDDFYKIGGMSLFVSPILQDKRFFYIQPHIDIDGISFDKLDKNKWTTFLNIIDNKNLYPIYTGKTGIQLFGNFLYKIEKFGEYDHNNILKKVIDKLQLSPNDIAKLLNAKTDLNVSMSKSPMPRFGYRSDTKRFIVPLIIDSYRELDIIRKFVFGDVNSVLELLGDTFGFTSFILHKLIPESVYSI